MRRFLVVASLMVLVAIGTGFQTDPNVQVGSPSFLHGTCSGSMNNGATTAIPNLGTASSGTCTSAVNLSAMANGTIVPKDCTLENLYAARMGRYQRASAIRRSTSEGGADAVPRPFGILAVRQLSTNHEARLLPENTQPQHPHGKRHGCRKYRRKQAYQDYLAAGYSDPGSDIA